MSPLTRAVLALRIYTGQGNLHVAQLRKVGAFVLAKHLKYKGGRTIERLDCKTYGTT